MIINLNIFNSKKIHLLAMLILSIICIFFINDSVNRDGILYLKQAYLFSLNNYQQAFSQYNWPFYSYLINLIYKFNLFDLETSAKLLNLILLFLAFNYFLKILFLLNQNERVYTFGTVLFLTFLPLFDNLIEYIVRDFGFIAFSIMGIYYTLSIKLLGKRLVYSVLLFSLAFLFRVEGLFFIFLSLILALREKYNFNFLKISLIFTFILFITFFLFYFFRDLSFINSSRFVDLIEYPFLLFQKFTNGFDFKSENIYLSDLLSKYNIPVGFVMMLSIVFFKYISGLGLFYIFYFYIRYSLIKFSSKDKLLIIFFVASLMLVIVNFFISYILSGRYLILNWIILLILIAPSVQLIFENNFKIMIYKFSIASTTIKYFSFLFFSVLFINILVDKSPNIEKSVVRYINSENIDKTNIFIDEDRIIYYLYKDISYVFETKNTNRLFLLLKNNTNNSYEDYEYIVGFPEKNPKYVLLKKIG